LISETDQSI